MPWKAFERDSEWCVYKIDAEDEPVGEALGCHPTKREADAQLAALYTNEPEAGKAIASDGAGDTAALDDLRAVKALGGNRIGSYLVLWGDEEHKDLSGEFFTPDTKGLLQIFKAVGKVPTFYQHGNDRKADLAVVGAYDVMEPDDIGLWTEAQLDLAGEYRAAIQRLIDKKALGQSSQTLASARKVAPNGEIQQWVIAEGSLTPTPCEWRMMERPVAELKAAYKSIGIELPAGALAGDTKDAESLAESEPAIKALLPEEGEKPSASAIEGAVKAERIEVVDRTDRKEPEMAEEDVKTTPEIDVDAIVQAAANKAVAELWAKMEAHPAVQKAIDLTPEGKDRPETKSFGDFCVAVMRGDTKRLESVYKSVKAELAETSGEVGGYLVPPEHSREILRVASENAVIRPRARIIPMTTRNFDMPALDYSGTDAGEPHSLGGVVMTWTEEGGEKTETEPEFANVALQYHELSGYTVASNMLRQDAPGLEALLVQLFGTAIGWFEDYAFLNGNGVGKPLGVFQSGCLLTEVAATSTFVLSDAAAMMEMFMGSSPSAGVWLMHPKVLSKLIQLADGSGAANNLIWQPNARESVPQSLFGKPIIFSEKMPVMPPSTSAATKGGVLLADFSYYLIGDRKQIAIDFSEHYKFIENKGTWRVCEYVDGQPWMKTYRTLADGSSTVSPFVTLAGA